MGDETSPYETLDDPRLVALAQAGDDAAMETVLARYKGLARRKAEYFFLAGGDVEDVTQEGMIGLYKAVRTFRPEHGVPFSTFAYYSVAARITDAVRTASRRKHAPLNDSVSLQGLTDADGEVGPDLLDIYIDVTRADPLQQYIGREAAESLKTFIETELTELERQCVARLIEGISYKETALRLGRSAKAVDNALHRARAKFERRMRTI